MVVALIQGVGIQKGFSLLFIANLNDALSNFYGSLMNLGKYPQGEKKDMKSSRVSIKEVYLLQRRFVYKIIPIFCICIIDGLNKSVDNE